MDSVVIVAWAGVTGRDALGHTLSRLKQVKAILKSNRDQLPEQLSLTAELPQGHENIRGPHNFH